MCRAANEGGQRCASHTRKALRQAESRYGGIPSMDHYDTLQSARAEFASTPTGQRELTAQMESLAADAPERVDFAAALRRGELLRQRNAELAAAAGGSAVPSPEKQQRLAGDPSTSSEALERLYAHAANNNVIVAALKHPNATDRMFQDVIRAGRDGHMSEIVGNPNVSGDMLGCLARAGGPLTQRYVAYHRRTPAEAIAHLLEHGNTDARSAISQRPDITPDQIDALTRDKSDHVRHSVSRRGDLTDDQVRRMASDSHWRVRYSTAQNPATPDDVLMDLHADPDARRALASNPRCPDAVADHLLDNLPNLDEDPQSIYPLLDLAQNPGASERILTRLASYDDEEVREVATRTLKERGL